MRRDSAIDSRTYKGLKCGHWRIARSFHALAAAFVAAATAAFTPDGQPTNIGIDTNVSDFRSSDAGPHGVRDYHRAAGVARLGAFAAVPGHGDVPSCSRLRRFVERADTVTTGQPHEHARKWRFDRGAHE